jgi:hypothetical protein
MRWRKMRGKSWRFSLKKSIVRICYQGEAFELFFLTIRKSQNVRAQNKYLIPYLKNSFKILDIIFLENNVCYLPKNIFLIFSFAREKVFGEFFLQNLTTR